VEQRRLPTLRASPRRQGLVRRPRRQPVRVIRWITPDGQLIRIRWYKLRKPPHGLKQLVPATSPFPTRRSAGCRTVPKLPTPAQRPDLVADKPPLRGR
jgi:hypothetical protein